MPDRTDEALEHISAALTLIDISPYRQPLGGLFDSVLAAVQAYAGDHPKAAEIARRHEAQSLPPLRYGEPTGLALPIDQLRRLNFFLLMLPAPAQRGT